MHTTNSAKQLFRSICFVASLQRGLLHSKGWIVHYFNHIEQFFGENNFDHQQGKTQVSHNSDSTTLVCKCQHTDDVSLKSKVQITQNQVWKAIVNDQQRTTIQAVSNWPSYRKLTDAHAGFKEKHQFRGQGQSLISERR